LARQLLDGRHDVIGDEPAPGAATAAVAAGIDRAAEAHHGAAEGRELGVGRLDPRRAGDAGGDDRRAAGHRDVGHAGVPGRQRAVAGAGALG
jgi:hypothetical protein